MPRNSFVTPSSARAISTRWPTTWGSRSWPGFPSIPMSPPPATTAPSRSSSRTTWLAWPRSWRPSKTDITARSLKAPGGDSCCHKLRQSGPSRTLHPIEDGGATAMRCAAPAETGEAALRGVPTWTMEASVRLRFTMWRKIRVGIPEVGLMA